tara:strand:+ start:4374 stop:4775 length:402 start_codon:yes stop_codon:yes gene_type:complete
MPFENDTTDLLDLKTIDRARGIILRDVTPFLPDISPRFILEWDGQGIPFGGKCEGDVVSVGKDEKKFHLTWTIHYIGRPEEFGETDEVLFQTIRDAMDCFGEFHDRERVHEVTVNFSDKVFTNTVPDDWSKVV